MAALPFLHPIHASSDGDHLLLWGIMGVGIGIAVVMGAWIVRELFRPEDARDAEPPGTPKGPGSGPEPHL